VRYGNKYELNERLFERKRPGFESAFSKPKLSLPTRWRGDKIRLDTMDETR
jgi:hypothetical protein